MTNFCNTLKKSMRAAVIAALCILCSAFTAYGETDDSNSGPGVLPAEETSELEEGESLGIFKTTGYCCCELCSSSSGLTYSGVAPQANHTISADLSILPLGAKVRIGDIIYTVEDIGGSVDGRKIDIFYSSHEEALAHGLSSVEVFLISTPEEEQTEPPVHQPDAPVSLNGPGDGPS